MTPQARCTDPGWEEPVRSAPGSSGGGHRLPTMPRLLPVLAATVLLLPGTALAQTEPSNATPTVPPAAGSETPVPTPAAPAQPAGVNAPPSSAKPTSAQQAVLDRIRRLRDGDQRRFGTCSYRWDRWKLQPDGSRTTSYSCEGSPPIVNHTIGVNCSKLQINSFNPNADRSGSSERGAWGSWRLPAPGGEEQMVATLCANALPLPAPASGTTGTSTAPTGAATAPRPGTAAPTSAPPAAPAGTASPAAGAASKTAPPTGSTPAAGP